MARKGERPDIRPALCRLAGFGVSLSCSGEGVNEAYDGSLVLGGECFHLLKPLP